MCLTLSPLVTLARGEVYRAKCISPAVNNPQSEEPDQPHNLNVRDPVLLYLWLSYQGAFQKYMLGLWATLTEAVFVYLQVRHLGTLSLYQELSNPKI